MRALAFFPMMAVLLLGIIESGAALADTMDTATDDAMIAIKGSIDNLNVRPSTFVLDPKNGEKNQAKALKVAIAPLTVEYPKKRRDLQPYYRDSDFQLAPRDVELLQKTIAETFTAAWFKQRNWQLVTDSATADVRLVIDIKDFWLAAPLNESIQVHKTFTEESAHFVLTGRVERTADSRHLIEFSDKRKVRPLGTPPGRYERFTALTFWRDMRLELSGFASQLNRLIPSGNSSNNS